MTPGRPPGPTLTEPLRDAHLEERSERIEDRPPEAGAFDPALRHGEITPAGQGGLEPARARRNASAISSSALSPAASLSSSSASPGP